MGDVKMKVYNQTRLLIRLSYLSREGKKVVIDIEPYGNVKLSEPTHISIDGIYTEVPYAYQEEGK